VEARNLDWQSDASDDSDGLAATNGERDGTHQRAGPSEQRLVAEMRELGGHLADGAIEGGYHRPRVTPAEKADQRGEAAGLRLARHCKLISHLMSTSHFLQGPPYAEHTHTLSLSLL